MGLLDKLLGRGKKAAGDATDDASLRREGSYQEAKGAAEDRADKYEDKAKDEVSEAARQAKRETES